MSTTTRTQIDNMQALTATGSITPSSLGVILESIETELDGNDSSYTGTDIHTRTKTLETTASNLSSRTTTAESTISSHSTSISNLQSHMTAAEANITSHGTTISGHTTQITALQTKTNMGSTTYGGANLIAPRPNAIPYYTDYLVADDDYPLQFVQVKTASSTSVDFSTVKLPESIFIIDCQDNIDLSSDLSSMSVHGNPMLTNGNIYRLTILGVIDASQHSQYNPSDIEYHAFIETM